MTEFCVSVICFKCFYYCLTYFDKKMYKALCLLFLAAVQCQDINNGDLNSVISQIFGKNPNANTGNKSGGNSQPPVIVKESSTIVPLININPSNPKDLSCTMDDGTVGECVSYYLCNGNNSIIDDGVGIIDIRVRDGPCESYIDTCCGLGDKRPVENPLKPIPEPKREGCGWRNPKGADLRTTGETEGETKFGEFPWMVAILRLEPIDENSPDSQKLNVYIGGGSLIHPSVVLTAAHDVVTPRSYRVRAGEWDTQSTKEIHPFQDRDVTSMAIHQDFNKGNLFYDIALLFLDKPMDLAPNVGVACLPTAKQVTLAGTRCFATGWGKDKFEKDGRYQVIMKKIELPVVDRDTCQTALRRTRLGRHFQLHSSFMCAGGEAGKDTCRGDGGSPLSCPIQYEENRYMQSGIVAWGIGCGENGIPGVYVDVGNLREWIDDKVSGKGYLVSTYTY